MAIKNYLKDVKEITAPLNWKSSPDSPPTQLAYVTKPEIDLLVKANLHGSMNGKPNKGPKGIISLDGGGSFAEETGGYFGSTTPNQDRPPVFGSTPATGGGGSSGDYNPNLNVATPQNQNQNQNQNNQIQGVIYTKDQFVNEEEKEKKDKKQQVLDLLFGAEGDTSVKKSAFDKDIKKGKHPLRAQLDYLIAKYGDSVLDTEQGKVLMGYLAGVPVERGGGLGARDEKYGGDKFATETGEANPELEKQRQELIKKISLMGTPFGATDIGALLAKVTREGIGADLTPEQYFNFRQQLMAADPTPENMAYKSAFPFSSGAGIQAVAEKFFPGANIASALTGGLLPERNLTGYQGMTDDFAAGFTPLPVQGEGVSSLPFALARNITPPSDEAGDDQDDQDDDAPTLPPIVPQTPFTPFDINAFYASLPQYTQQGIMNPNLMSYYQNLGMFPGMAV